MSTIHKVDMITYYQDNGDGSSTTKFYNTLDELKAEKIGSYGWKEEKWQALLDDDDPYENGSLDSATLTVFISDDGAVTIKPFSSYSGNQ